MHTMTTSFEDHIDALGTYCERLTDAVADLTNRLQAHYEMAFPGHREAVRNAITEAEATAWEISNFPHLFLPDLVEARIEELISQPAFARSEVALVHAA